MTDRPLRTDVLHNVQSQALTTQQLAALLERSVDATQHVLDALESDGFVVGSPDGFVGASSPQAQYTITAKGKAAYGVELDRLAVEMMGTPATTVVTRFIFALADDAPPALREHLLKLLDSAPPERHDSDRRSDALHLAKGARGFGKLALERDAASKALASALPTVLLVDGEDFGSVATLLHGYADEVEDDSLRTVVELAAAACDAAFELRTLSPPVQRGHTSYSHDRLIDEREYFEVADQTAATLKALAHARRDLDLVVEADTLIRTLRPRS